jgi:hypothetical protein
VSEIGRHSIDGERTGPAPSQTGQPRHRNGSGPRGEGGAAGARAPERASVAVADIARQEPRRWLTAAEWALAVGGAADDVASLVDRSAAAP